ncbi:MAG: 7-carboxy-7-deazaguanine synthase QueE [Gammaproteobacteria bacterium]|nr:7-carboxy-7-deazaguanine synthase QueE [Gammaproteobacteria bacterium]MBT4081713.1 7-carboxy-7-deazaguanine synthase QueE [Gammaproteobacteria bacterium]MBT5360790.1 7-carboxy-7-deazaguanine synthase QueE [Gammaproteobacteria bacterium]MBT5636323.1 7-carboxy-7-deazaguanine synthase QueE [Gammaproteobacteria bacterium]MBT6079766.1 7-carboxy-7-deazaguanine synthase QueE [Gammaproteobacteria bacterium]
MSGEAARERDTLLITEIFLSLQGESRSVGWPTTFIRLTGCPLRCHYCDTEYAFQGGERITIDTILQQVENNGARHVTVTGGEPLVQKEVYPLMKQLCDAGYKVSVETGGMVDISEVDSRVERVVDLKTPASGEVEQNHWDNLNRLTKQDQLKVVIQDRADYEWFLPILKQYQLDQRCEVLLSPVQGVLEPSLLAEWILQDKLNVRFQLQLHKILWGNETGR